MTATPMAADEFWMIIERAKRSDQDDHAAALRVELDTLSLDRIIGFEAAFRSYLNRAYSWDLWGAAYVIHGGCSDDGFEYFRRWLVAEGRSVYEAAMANPDSLSAVRPDAGPGDFWEFELIYYVANDANRAKGGQNDVRDHSEPEAGLAGSGPAGEPFDEDSEQLSARYPSLWARFGDSPLG